jgi:hypothetical protein
MSEMKTAKGTDYNAYTKLCETLQMQERNTTGANSASVLASGSKESCAVQHRVAGGGRNKTLSPFSPRFYFGFGAFDVLG